jgi:tetratricopeptide (TPR) repeat protein
LILVLTKRRNIDAAPKVRQYFELPSSQEIRLDFNTRVKNLTPGTATWFLELPAFVEWSQCVKPVLSLRGAPGSGKSYLSTMALKHLYETTDGTSVIGHYYFHERNPSVLNALRSIVYQLTEENKTYGEQVSKACDQAPSLSAATISSTWNDFILPEFGNDAKVQLWLVFDGVDEARPDHIQELVSLVQSSLEEGSRIQVLLVGRPEIKTLTSPLDEFSTDPIEVSDTLNSQDIARFIEHKYNDCKWKLNFRGQRELVTTALRKKANGMFLWVDLTYRELSSIKKATKLKQTLEDLPTELTVLYSNIFARIQANASGPEQLVQLREFFCVLAHSEKSSTLLYLNQLLESVSEGDSDVEDLIENSCASLISLEERGQLLLKNLTKADMFDEEALQSKNMDGLEPQCDFEEADEVEIERQSDTVVKLRHASIGDYLKSKNLQSSEILLNKKDVAYHMVKTHLRIICAGEDAPESLWLDLMVTIWNELRNLDERSLFPHQIRAIIELLWELFTSESLAKYIAQVHVKNSMPDLMSDGFFLGSNIDLEHPYRQAIVRWLKLAEKEGLQELKPEIRSWVQKILQAPLQLLVPQAKTCIEEWINYDDDEPYDLSYRFCFAWYCVITVSCGSSRSLNSTLPFLTLFQTDLIPPISTDSVIFIPSSSNSMNGNPFRYLASLIRKDMTIELHCLFGRTMASCDKLELAKDEYQTAIELAEEAQSDELMHKIYLEAILSLSNHMLEHCHEMVADLAPKYLAFDKSDYRVHACMGVCELKEDRQIALQSFRVALALEPRDYLVFKTLIYHLFQAEDYNGIIEILSSQNDDSVRSIWIRGSIGHFDIQRWIFHAAKETGNANLISNLYELELVRPYGDVSNEDKPPRNGPRWRYPVTNIFHKRLNYSKGTAFLTCWLGHFYQSYCGNSQQALKLWATVFLQRSDIYALYTWFVEDIVSMFLCEFAKLLHDQALRPDGTVDYVVLRYLQRLKQRHDALQDSLKVSHSFERAIDIMLAQLYLRLGQTKEAYELLDEAFQRSTEGVKEGYEWRRGMHYSILSRILFTAGFKRHAAIAQSLRRFSYFGGKQYQNLEEKDEGGDEGKNSRIQEEGGYCSMELDCASNRHLGENLYACMTCPETMLCESCYQLQTSKGDNPEWRRLHICHAQHEHIKTPLEDWELKDNIMTIEGNTVTVSEWIERVGKEWNAHWKL